MFVDEGDEIILPDLFWGNYKLILINGYNAKLIAFETFKENRFNVEGLKEKLTKGKGKKIVLLNFRILIKIIATIFSSAFQQPEAVFLTPILIERMFIFRNKRLIVKVMHKFMYIRRPEVI